MNTTTARKVFLQLFIAFLLLTALIAIVSVLSGDFGEFQLKTLATTFSISTASICAMSCAAFIEKRRQRELGIAGISFAVLAALLVVIGIWAEFDNESYWKTTVSCIVIAVALAHGFLLHLPRLGSDRTWIQAVSSVVIAVLAIQIIAAVWGEFDDEVYLKLLAATSIVVVLLTLVIPVMARIAGGESDGNRKALLLSRQPDGTYIDDGGNVYQVTQVESLPGIER